jgi:plasmid stabilization system protein ParE
MKARVSLAAERDLAEAAAYYDRQMPGLGAQFLNEAEAALNRIISLPGAWQPLSPNTRRCRLHRFPYGLVYSIRGDEILIVAVGHLHREPEHWRGSGEE